MSPTLFLTLAVLQVPGPPPPAIDVPGAAFAVAQAEFVTAAAGARRRVKLGHGRPMRLVRMLASGSWEVRDEATALLLTLGPESIPALVAGAAHPDAEVQSRCARMLDRFWCSHCRNRGACRKFRSEFRHYRTDAWVFTPPNCWVCGHEYTFGGDQWKCGLCGRGVAFDVFDADVSPDP